MNNAPVKQLESTARVIRKEIVKMITKAGSGHPGGSLSATDILTALYFNVMRHDPKRPEWEDRDRFILSKGHAAPALYAVLAEAGYYPKEWLSRFSADGSQLQKHPDRLLVPGIEISTGAVFLTRRACDQVWVSLAYSDTNVKMMGIEAGLSSGRNGASHQAIEDLALMRSMPNMVVMAPLDVVEIGAAVRAAIKHSGPVYMRMRRHAVPVIFGADCRLEWGKAVTMLEGQDVGLISTGIMTEETLKAQEMLAKDGIGAEVLHIHTLKPLDADAVLRLAQKTGAVVTVENHSVYGGLGSAVAEILGENLTTPMKRIGILDLFGETGSREYLFEKFKLRAEDVAQAAKDVIKRKGPAA